MILSKVFSLLNPHMPNSSKNYFVLHSLGLAAGLTFFSNLSEMPMTWVKPEL